jgi:hypothetical protein
MPDHSLEVIAFVENDIYDDTWTRTMLRREKSERTLPVPVPRLPTVDYDTVVYVLYHTRECHIVWRGMEWLCFLHNGAPNQNFARFSRPRKARSFLRQPSPQQEGFLAHLSLFFSSAREAHTGWLSRQRCC